MEDVRPEHDAPAVSGCQLTQTQNVLQVEAPRTQVPRLITVDVQPSRAERWQQISIQFFQQRVRLLASRCEAPAPADFVQVAVLRKRQQMALVSKGLEVGDKLDVTLLAVLV